VFQKVTTQSCKKQNHLGFLTSFENKNFVRCKSTQTLDKKKGEVGIEIERGDIT